MWLHRFIMILDGNTFSSRLMRTLTAGRLQIYLMSTVQPMLQACHESPLSNSFQSGNWECMEALLPNKLHGVDVARNTSSKDCHSLLHMLRHRGRGCIVWDTLRMGDIFSRHVMDAPTGSLVFRAGLFSEWFDERIRPFVHYIPVRQEPTISAHDTILFTYLVLTLLFHSPAFLEPHLLKLSCP